MKRFVAGVSLLAMFMMGSAQDIYPKREMRAVWVATVKNIDWPSKPGLSVAEQKQEMISLLDIHRQNRMNAIVMQIRPAADAFYPSDLEPWSQWLTGVQGQPPEPCYDPLSFAIEECHIRCMEFHAWLNPYRAVVDYDTAVTDSMHLTNIHPEWFLAYGENRYFNPGLQETRDFVARVVGDIVRRYDIDALHFDDYFYPYKIPGEEFPDEETFRKYPRGFLPDQKEDWRRDNVDLIIQQLQDTIQSIKPWVKFGISPFGVWRNKETDPMGSDTKAGQTNYDDLYADILKWLREGWIDYVTPQAYWHIGFDIADHKKISEWWNLNSYGKDLYIGNGVYRLSRKSNNKEWHSSMEIERQIRLSRLLENVSGNFYFSSKVFQRNPLRLNQTIRKKIYPYPAIVPENHLTESIPPIPPGHLEMIRQGKTTRLRWQSGKENNDMLKYYIIYRFPEGLDPVFEDPSYIFKVIPVEEAVLSTRRRLFKRNYTFVITTLNRFHLESSTSELLEISY